MSTDTTTPPQNVVADKDGNLKVKMPKIRRGRHPEVTAGAFGNGRTHNGIKYRTSSLIRRFR
jgi:hypothetical protein